jgi:hypothetical protein
MTEEFESEASKSETEAVVRQQSFDVDGPIEVDLAVGAGRIEVRLVEEPGAHVEVRHDPGAGTAWMAGVSSVLTWFNGQFGDQLGETSPGEAVRQTRIDLTGGRLVVRAPKALPLRTVPLSVTVRAPAGSHVTTHSGSANVTVTGGAGRIDLQTGSGEISADRAEGTASVHTGSGTVRLGPMHGGLRARTGTGDVEVTALAGPTSLFTGSGDVWLGAVAGDVMARTGSGDLTVADATAGQIELQTGSGNIRVGVHAGSPAEVDLSSATGAARSELVLTDSRPEGSPTLRIRGRTASGSAIISPAVTG